jgi:hypothetical protein
MKRLVKRYNLLANRTLSFATDLRFGKPIGCRKLRNGLGSCFKPSRICLAKEAVPQDGAKCTYSYRRCCSSSSKILSCASEFRSITKIGSPLTAL